MPHALLLSPDDQAVNAITGVLEEMSVTCERPLDGVSAAQELSSHSFDLVLVDCENLPAAKLIFDVCRRGKNGNNPVPIAIVDGRAGLPTAFRLGAELILTKPVAKDQARNTIRNAVSRVRKEVQKNDSVPGQPASAATASVTMTSPGLTEERAQAAAAAAVSPQLTSFADPDPNFAPASVAVIATATVSGPAPTTQIHSAALEDDIVVKPANPELTRPSAASATFLSSESSPAPASSENSEARPSLKPSDHPALANLERVEPAKSKPETLQPAKAARNESPAEARVMPLSSRQQDRKKTNGSLAALLMLALAGSGFYAAWTYQPGFRAIVQPQIDRLLVMGGMALPPTPTSAKSLTHGTASTPAVPASGSPLHPTPATGRGSTAGSATGSADTSAAASAPVHLAATSLSGTPNAAAPVDARPLVKSGTNEMDTTPTPSAAQLPGESSAIILSSKGAEKRLAQSAPPQYPVDARSGDAEGTVVLKEVVDENGKVAGVRLVEGNAVLASAAIKAVKQWRYRPYLHDGKAQPFQTVVIIDFQRP